MIDIRPYKEGDEQDIMLLDRLVEVHPWNRRDLPNWYWKYKGDNPAGEPIIFVADNEGELIAHFAVIPMWYWINGEKIRGSHSIAMIVKPAWQNRGLIKFVADKMLKEVERQKIPFTYGYPNDNAYDLHITHLGYSDISMQALFQKTLDGASEHFITNFPAGLQFKGIEEFDHATDALWDETKHLYKVIVIRNADFLNWRYSARPDITYYSFGAYDNGRLVGYCVLKLYQEEAILRGHFIDLFTRQDKEDYALFLVEKGLEFFKTRKVHEVNLWMQGSLFLRKILQGYGFQKVSSRPMICRFNLDQERYKSLLCEDNWYFTMGDTLEIY
ncbi:MAG: GNAT family N-acetyltransferase [bacterium]